MAVSNINAIINKDIHKGILFLQLKNIVSGEAI